MQPNVLVFFCLAGVLGNARTFPDLLQESDDNDLLFDDQLIHPMQSDEFVDPIIDPDVDPSVGLDEAISLDQDTSWLAKLGEYCTSPTESPERLVDKIRVRRQSCISPKSTPPPPKVEPSSLKLPEEPKHQSPWLGGFPLAAPFIKYPQCYDKMPYCCPSGRMPDNTFQGCKPYSPNVLPWLCGNPLFIYCCDYVDLGENGYGCDAYTLEPTWNPFETFP